MVTQSEFVDAEAMIANVFEASGESSARPEMVELTKMIVRVCNGYDFETAVNACGNAFGSFVLCAPNSASAKMQTLQNLCDNVVNALVAEREQAMESSDADTNHQ